MKCFRCGWCGTRVTASGAVIPTGKANGMDVDWDSAEMINGDCCGPEQEDIQRQVTHEMAMDAGR